MKKPKKQPKHSATTGRSKVIFDVTDADRDLFLEFLARDTIPHKDESSEDLRSKHNRSKKDLPLQKVTIDLHGLSILDAQQRLEVEITALAIRGCNEVVIITGRGKHSSNQTHTLAREIPAFIRRKFGNLVTFLTDIDFDPALSQLPLKGSFSIKVIAQNRR